jgi:hypothetical protein
MNGVACQRELALTKPVFNQKINVQLDGSLRNVDVPARCVYHRPAAAAPSTKPPPVESIQYSRRWFLVDEQYSLKLEIALRMQTACGGSSAQRLSTIVYLDEHDDFWR